MLVWIWQFSRASVSSAGSWVMMVLLGICALTLHPVWLGVGLHEGVGSIPGWCIFVGTPRVAVQMLWAHVKVGLNEAEFLRAEVT